MAVLNVLANGNAPANAQIGDTIRTAGGNFRVVAPNTSGANFNPSSGLWSVRDPDPEYLTNAKDIVDRNNAAMTDAAEAANDVSERSSARQYEYNAREAQKSRDWQEYMSNTAHQRQVLDLIAAGLNPVLSATLGGSSTPSGATASGSSYSGQKADVDTNLLNFFGSVYSTILGNESAQNIARINAETAMQTAKMSSAAQMYSANKAAQASMYGANQAAAASRYGADLSSAASRYGADLGYSGKIDTANPLYRSGSALVNEIVSGKRSLHSLNDFRDQMLQALKDRRYRN